MPSRTTKAFDQSYARLNAEQKQAVDTIDGPVMVVAGPGTGKTQTIALRIANILRSVEVKAHNILALTFTDSGARAMRERLIAMIGPDAYRVQIHTFHSFCMKVIQENPDSFTGSSSGEPIADLDKIKIIYRGLDTLNLKLLRPLGAPRLYTSAIISSISDAKREGVTPTILSDLLDQEESFLASEESQELKKTERTKREKNLAKTRELVKVYQYYQQELTKLGTFDFDDMVADVVRTLSTNPDLLLDYQERFQYLLIDEYQDTNNAQNKLALLLASYWGDTANIFVTGDPDQCLPAGTLISTEDGDRPIETIAKNQHILTAVGKGYTTYAPVTNIFKHTRKIKMISLTLATGQKISATYNHKMFCFIPPREQTKYWYVCLMFKKGLGWRIGTTIGLSHRLKMEGDADKIIGIKTCESEVEARYYEIVYSLKYQIPTVIFKARKNMITGTWLTDLYTQFDTSKNALALAHDLSINLDEPHYQRDGTTFGKGRTKINLYMNNRSYRTKYSNDGLLKSPAITHEIDIQTNNPAVLEVLQKRGFKIRNHHIGKGYRLTSHDLSQLYKIGKELEVELDGILDIKFSVGTKSVQHKPTRIMQIGNILVGNYLPVLVGHHIEYAEVISKSEAVEEVTTYDLEVYPSHNFIANGIVVHNSIMRFQGASIANQLSFIKVYPKAKVVTLQNNYRSTQTILDAAHNVISHNNLRINDVVAGVDSHLKSTTDHTSPIKLATLSSGTAELIFIATSISDLIKNGVNPADIAVIYRKNADAKELARVLIKFGIDYSIEGGSDILDDPTIRNFLKFFEVLLELRTKEDDTNLFTILHYPFFQIDPLDILRLTRAASDLRTNLFELISDPASLDSLTLITRPAIDQTLTLIARFQSLESELTFVELFELMLKESGYLDYVLTKPDSHHRIARLNTLFDSVKQMNHSDHQLNIESFLANLELMEQNHLRLEEGSYGTSTSAVTLTTAHKSKGLEWQHVYIYKCIDGEWGNNRRPSLLTLPEGIITNLKLSSKDDNEEERCLFYVGMTRAKHTLTLTKARAYNSNGREKVATDTIFHSEIGDAHTIELDVKAIEESSRSHLETILTSTPSDQIGSSEASFLRPLVDDFKLSATALNSYLKCGYRFKLEKILRIPQAKKPHLAFGTAVHAALEAFYKQVKERAVPDKQYLLSSFHNALAKEVITPRELIYRQEAGDQILGAYYDLTAPHFSAPLFLEKFTQVELDDITLTGKIDRVEWASEASRTLRVVDYKTGHSKTMGQIKGTTQDSDGDLERQLIFYKLLIDLDSRLNNLTLGEAVLDFVEEPSAKGKLGIRSFHITAEQVDSLKATIKQVMGEIRSLNFVRTTNYRHCTDCPFSAHCWPDGIPS